MAVYTRRGVERSRVEDLVADVYATAWRRFEDLPVDRERTAEWLFGVARHVYLNLCRSERRHAALAERLARVGDPVARGQPDEARVTAAQVWRSLSQADRDVLLLVIDSGVSLGELARRLGCSYSAAAARLSRARQRLSHGLT